MKQKQRAILIYAASFIAILIISVQFFKNETHPITADEPDEADFAAPKVEVKTMPEFSAPLLSNSLLPAIHATGELHVCLQSRIPRQFADSFPRQYVNLRSSDVGRLVTKAVRAWISFLRFHKTWKSEEPKIVFHYSQTDCDTHSGIKLTFIADLGPVRSEGGNDSCIAREVDKVSGRYFAAPDDRVCVATYNSETRTALISAGGNQGEFAAVAHLVGHALGLADTHDSNLLKDTNSIDSDNSIMSPAPMSFKEADVAAINSLWTRLTVGLPCHGSTSNSEKSNRVYSSLRCSHSGVVESKLETNGAQSCPENNKYWLNQSQSCIPVDSAVRTDCSEPQTVYDPNSAVCCPAGQAFDASRLACSPALFMKKRSMFLLKNMAQ